MSLSATSISLNLSSLSPIPPPAADPLDTGYQLCPEPLAHEAVNIKVKTGVEDNEDMVEVSHTEPEARDGMPASLVTHGHSNLFGVIQHLCIALVLPFFTEIFVNNEYFIQFCQEPHAVAQQEG